MPSKTQTIELIFPYTGLHVHCSLYHSKRIKGPTVDLGVRKGLKLALHILTMISIDQNIIKQCVVPSLLSWARKPLGLNNCIFLHFRLLMRRNHPTRQGPSFFETKPIIKTSESKQP